MPAEWKLALYVDRLHQQWVVRDPEGNYWTLPMEDNPWENRQPYYRTEDAALDPIPGHYRYTLGLPF